MHCRSALYRRCRWLFIAWWQSTSKSKCATLKNMHYCTYIWTMLGEQNQCWSWISQHSYEPPFYCKIILSNSKTRKSNRRFSNSLCAVTKYTYIYIFFILEIVCKYLGLNRKQYIVIYIYIRPQLIYIPNPYRIDFQLNISFEK